MILLYHKRIRVSVLRRTLALLLTLCAAFALLPARAAKATGAYSWVKVKLTANNATSLSISTSGTYFIKENGMEFSGGTLTVRAYGNSLTVSHSQYGELYTGASCSILRANVERTAGFLSFNGRKYLGHFHLRATSGGYIQVVNEVPMAHYLYGVVGYEMSELTFGIEALRAQAIAAKCYVINQMGSGEYHIGDTSADQVYRGYNASYNNVIAAVDSTLDQVLVANGSIIRSYFAASNGGETNLPSYAWPNQGRSDVGFGISIDPADLANTYSKKEVVRIPVNTPGSLSAPLHRLVLEKASAALGMSMSGIEAITYVSTEGPAYAGVTRNLTTCTMSAVVTDGMGTQYQTTFTFRLSELYARGAVSDGTLRIYWGEQVGDQYNIYHLRYGHGVGLSQRGAQQRANEGQNYQQILAFYYPQASLSATGDIQPPSNPVNTLAGQAPVPGALPVPAATPAPVAGAPAVIAYGMINYPDTNYRTGPGTDHQSYGKLQTGEALLVYGESGNWYHVGVNGVLAYVYKQYVDITPTSGVAPVATAVPGVVPVMTPVPVTNPAPAVPAALGIGVLKTSSVNFRTAPSTSARSLGKFDKGDVVQVFGQEGSWLYVSIDNTYGYVSASYVQVQSVAQTAAPAVQPVETIQPDAPAARQGMLTTSNVNLRQEATTASASLKKLKKNTAVTVMAEQGDWYYVEVNGQYGYVYRSYVRITGTAAAPANGAAPAAGTGVTTGKVNLRTGPGASYNKVTTLKKNASLTILGEANGWYNVAAGGKTGYVSGKYVKVTAALPAPPAAVPPSPTAGTAPAEENAAPVVTAVTGETTRQVNFRDGSSTSAKKLALLPKGAPLTLYKLENDWFEADYKGTRGYISAEYVKVRG
ncbi:MAG: SH3 domain-containing protein [Clostridia bacterium]|nr:SH3 domain-containing protein [Clostridia bacterium]